MKQETILKKAREVLNNNKGYQEAVNEHKEMLKKFPQWGEPESIEKLIFQWDNGTVILSNEGCISLCNDYYNTELLYGLDEEFKKAGLFVEPYDGGTFIISEE